MPIATQPTYEAFRSRSTSRSQRVHPWEPHGAQPNHRDVVRPAGTDIDERISLARCQQPYETKPTVG
jgi:hypothetical protein